MADDDAQYHAAQMAKTPTPVPLSLRQFASTEELVDQAERIKRKAQVRAQPRPGSAQPYLPFDDEMTSGPEGSPVV